MKYFILLLTCTHGVCDVLSQVGIRFGDKEEARTTYELINQLVKKQMQIDDPKSLPKACQRHLPSGFLAALASANK